MKTSLRLPPDLHADVHTEAKRQNRTFNGQIIATLRQGLPRAQQESTDAKT